MSVFCVGAHPLAGASTWARFLSLQEAPELVVRATAGPVVIVARSTVNGVRAAKRVNGDLPAHVARLVLLIADAPGSPPALVRAELTGLEATVAVVRVPWLEALRGLPVSTVAGAAIARPLAKVTAALSAALVQVSVAGAPVSELPVTRAGRRKE